VYAVCMCACVYVCLCARAHTHTHTHTHTCTHAHTHTQHTQHTHTTHTTHTHTYINVCTAYFCRSHASVAAGNAGIGPRGALAPADAITTAVLSDLMPGALQPHLPLQVTANVAVTAVNVALALVFKGAVLLTCPVPTLDALLGLLRLCVFIWLLSVQHCIMVMCIEMMVLRRCI